MVGESFRNLRNFVAHIRILIFDNLIIINAKVEELGYDIKDLENIGKWNVYEKRNINSRFSGRFLSSSLWSSRNDRGFLIIHTHIHKKGFSLSQKYDGVWRTNLFLLLYPNVSTVQTKRTLKIIITTLIVNIIDTWQNMEHHVVAISVSLIAISGLLFDLLQR